MEDFDKEEGLLGFNNFVEKKKDIWKLNLLKNGLDDKVMFSKIWDGLNNMERSLVLNKVRADVPYPSYFERELVSKKSLEMDAQQKLILLHYIKTEFPDFLGESKNSINEAKEMVDVKIDLKRFEDESPMLFDTFKDKCKKAKLPLNGNSISLKCKREDSEFAYVVLVDKPLRLEFPVPIEYVPTLGKKVNAKNAYGEDVKDVEENSKYVSLFVPFDINKVKVPSDIFDALEAEFPETQILNTTDDSLSEETADQLTNFVSKASKAKASYTSEDVIESGEPKYTLTCHKKMKCYYGILTNNDSSEVYLVVMPKESNLLGSIVELY